MSRLVFEPTTHIIAATGFAPGAIEEWAYVHGLDDVAGNPGTPLGRIVDDINKLRQSSLDLVPEFGGRFCYRAWNKGRGNEEYIKNIIEQGHGSVLEHASVTFAITGVSRSFSHELVRHRQGVAISQESQRYVDAKDVRFVVPPLMIDIVQKDGIARSNMENLCEFFVGQYEAFQASLHVHADQFGWDGTELKKRVNEASRCILPNMTETRLVWTANLRALRHICSLRGSAGADLEIRRWAVTLTELMQVAAPNTFADFKIVEGKYQNIPDTIECQYPKV